MTPVELSGVPAAPGKVWDLRVAPVAYSVNISWRQPVKPNGVALRYGISWYSAGPASNCSSSLRQQGPALQDENTQTNCLITGLKLHTRFIVSVLAVNGFGSGSEVSVAVNTSAVGKYGSTQGAGAGRQEIELAC